MIWENITYHKNCRLPLHFPLISVKKSSKDYSDVEREFQTNESSFFAKLLFHEFLLKMCVKGKTTEYNIALFPQ